MPPRTPDMETRKITSAAYFRNLSILHFAMMASQILFAATVIGVAMVGELPPPNAELGQVFVYVLIAVASSGLGLSFVLFNRWVAAAAEKATLSEKLRAYQTAAILRLAMMEAPSLLAIVGFYLTGIYWFFIVTALVLVVFGATVPAKARVQEGLRLGHEEVNLLNDPKAIVAEFEVSAD